MAVFAHDLNEHPAGRASTLTRWLGAALIGIALAVPSAGAVADEICGDGSSAVYIDETGEPYVALRVCDDDAAEAAPWPGYEVNDRAAAEHARSQAAAEEAAGWPDFDPSDMWHEVAITEAQQEVVGLPDLNPSDTPRGIAASQAGDLPQGWPEYGHSSIASESAVASSDVIPWPDYADPNNVSQGALASSGAAPWPGYDVNDRADAEFARSQAATEEAAGWPDFDPSDMSQEVAITEAQQEAAGWPDLDPSDMSPEVAATEAEEISQGWPEYADPGTFAEAQSEHDTASGSPRLNQIAAYQDDEVAFDEVTAQARGNPY